MAISNVFRGSDADLVLAVDDSSTVEGGLADALITEYELSTVVGRLQNVQVSVLNDVKPYHEIGKRFATELRPGNINIQGSAERAHINGALLRLLLGDGAISPAPTGVQHRDQSERPGYRRQQQQDRAVRRQVRELVVRPAGKRFRDGIDHLPGAAHRQ
jgi:hypothetical protein